MAQNDSYQIPQTEPLLIVISGPSGVGKDTVIQNLVQRDHNFCFVVTTTSRPKREGEREGIDYFFVSRDEFERMIAQEELLEWAVVYDDYKGITKSQIRKAIDSGQDVILRVDVQGSAFIRKICPQAVTIFLTTQDEDELVQRLKTRKSEPPDKLAKRIETARQELRRIDEFDYVVVNQDQKLDETTDIIASIITAEHHRVKPRKVNL